MLKAANRKDLHLGKIFIIGHMTYARVGIIGHLLGPGFSDFAHVCLRVERLGTAKSLNLGPERCAMTPNPWEYFIGLGKKEIYLNLIVLKRMRERVYGNSVPK